MAAQLHHEENSLVLRLSGEIDLATAGGLERALEKAEEQRPRRLVVDLAHVCFMDCTGLRALLAASRRAEREGRQLTLRPGPPGVQRLFEVAGVIGELTLEDG